MELMGLLALAWLGLVAGCIYVTYKEEMAYRRREWEAELRRREESLRPKW